jgi:membrane peptidoglycan carboxypeptidase
LTDQKSSDNIPALFKKMNKLNTGKASIFALTAVITLAAVLLGKSFSTAFANHDPFGGVVQTSVRLCHATGNGGFVSNSPNISGTGGNLNLQGHEGAGIHVSDIIPPFHWSDNETTYSYAGKNWNSTNGAIWAANCGNATPTVSSSPSPSASPSPSPSASPSSSPSASPSSSPSATPEESSTPSPTPTATPSNGDVCLNIDGIQTSVPSDLHLGADGTSCVSFSVPGVPESPAVGGQVLGASTMATAGSFAESLYMAIMGLGGTLSTAGFVLSKKLSKKA